MIWPVHNNYRLGCLRGRRRAAKFLGVLTLRTTIAGTALGVTVDGENEHARVPGRPEQERETG